MVRLASTISLIALLAAMPEPAVAQGLDGTTILRRLNQAGVEIEQALAAAEAARLAGQCDKREAQLKRAKSIIEELEGLQSRGGGLGGDLERTKEARARAQAILNAPCPPVAEMPAPAPVAVNREPGQTRTLEDLQIEYAATLCGAEQEEAKRRLLVALQRAIDMERNPAKRDRLLAQRDWVAARPVKPCDADGKPATGVAAPATPPASVMDDMQEGAVDEATRQKARIQTLDEIEDNLKKAEAARLAGKCADRDRYIWNVRFLEGAMITNTGLFSPESAEAIHDRIENAAARPCPPEGTPKEVGALPQSGSPLAAVAAVQEDRRARMAERAAVLLNVYYLASLIPRGNIGVRRDGAPGAAPEVDAGRTPRRVNGFGISAGFQTKIAPDFDLRLTGTYEKGDAESAVNVPVTGAQRVDTGIVYGRLSNGSSGIIAGFGGTGSAKVDLEEWGVGVEAGWQIGDPSYIPYTVGLRALVGADYKRSERKYQTSIASSGVSAGTTFSFSQSRLQRLEENYYGVSVGLEADIPICPDADLTLLGKGGPYRVDTRFIGTERNTANFGPVGNRDFTLNFDEDNSKWGARFETGASVQYHVSDTLTITGGVRYEYRTDTGAVFNPNSGDQVFFDGKTTGLTRQDWQAWDAAVGLKLRF
jgi:hypothetical protein